MGLGVLLEGYGDCAQGPCVLPAMNLGQPPTSKEVPSRDPHATFQPEAGSSSPGCVSDPSPCSVLQVDVRMLPAGQEELLQHELRNRLQFSVFLALLTLSFL